MKTTEDLSECKSREEVVDFINSFLNHSTNNDEEREALRHTFRAGYCYYFATMLQAAFNRGTICWAAPYSHVVWVDDNGCPYDIEGIYSSEANLYIPVSFLGDFQGIFLHVNEDGPFPSWDDIVRIIRNYEDSCKKPHIDLDYFKPKE